MIVPLPAFFGGFLFGDNDDPPPHSPPPPFSPSTPKKKKKNIQGVPKNSLTTTISGTKAH